MCRGTKTPKPPEIRALHHTFLIDVGAEKAGAEWFQPADHFFRTEVRGLAPAFDDDLAVLGIQSNDDAFRTKRSGNRAEGGSERSGAHDDLVSALCDKTAGTLGGSHPAPD